MAFTTSRKFLTAVHLNKTSLRKNQNYFQNSITVLLTNISVSATPTRALNKMSSIECKKFKAGTPKIGTHGDTFHCDEALGCFMLKLLPMYKNAEIIRTRNPELLKTCDIVLDVGGVFNPEENLFDHHQASFKETFSSLNPQFGDKFDIRLSSAGLIYTHFGKQIIAEILEKGKEITLTEDVLNLLYVTIYENFMREIDAIDNGVPMFDDEPRFYISTDISSRVSRINPLSNTDANIDELFTKAMSLVGNEFVERVVFYGCHWIHARQKVKAALENAKSLHDSGEILELETHCPWKTHIFNLENELEITNRSKYVIFTNKPNDWRVMSVPLNPKSFVCRKFLHKEWRGLRSEELREISKVSDAVFVHSTGFIGGAESRNGALQMALKSLNDQWDESK